MPNGRSYLDYDPFERPGGPRLAEKENKIWLERLSDTLGRYWRALPDVLTAPFDYVWGLVRTTFSVIGALVLVVLKTFYVLLPSTAHSARDDARYDKQKIGQFDGIIQALANEDRVDPYQVKVLRDCWLDQIAWTSGRATRERNADELIRWWQIIFGVLIPVLVNLQLPDRMFVIGTLRISQDAVISTLGITVAILTAVYQFRRPEQRWRHYRTLCERYQNEFWSYVSLAGSYRGLDHRAAFHDFNSRMIGIREEDVTRFFGEVMPLSAQAREAERELQR